MKDKVYVCDGLKDLSRVAASLIEDYPENNVFAVYGKMGAGKTTLIQAFCKYLGVEDKVVSPTFTIVNEYIKDGIQPVYHFDFYRIKNDIEAMDIGYEEYLYSGNYCFIEWPEKIEKLLPDKYVYLAIEEGERKDVRLIWHSLVSL